MISFRGSDTGGYGHGRVASINILVDWISDVPACTPPGFPVPGGNADQSADWNRVGLILTSRCGCMRNVMAQKMPSASLGSISSSTTITILAPTAGDSSQASSTSTACPGLALLICTQQSPQLPVAS